MSVITKDIGAAILEQAKENTVLLLGANDLKNLKLNFGRKKFLEIEIDGAIFQFKKFNVNSKNIYCLVLRKLNILDDLNSVEKFDFNESSVNINKKLFSVKPFEYTAPSKNTEEKIDLNKTKELLKNTFDNETLSLKIQELYSKTTESYLTKEHVIEPKQELYEQLESLRKEKKDLDFENNEKFIEEPPIKLASAQDILFSSPTIELNPISDFIPSIELEKLIKPAPISSFWFQVDNSFVSSQELWHRLSIFWRGTPKDTEYKLKEFYREKQLPITYSFKKSESAQTPLFIVQMQQKVNDLNNKNAQLEKQISQLEQSILDAGEQPKDSPEYLLKIEERAELNNCIQHTKRNLDAFVQKIMDLKEIHKDQTLKFYIHVFGRHSLLSKYDELIGNKFLSLNDQINQICSLQEEVERTLIEKIQQIHFAWKAKVKQQFLESETRLIDSLKIDSQTDQFFNNEKKRKTLSEVGELHESAAMIQEKINKEYKKLNYFLDNLKTIENIDNYDQKLQQIFYDKQKLHIRKEKFQKYLHQIRIKINLLEETTYAFVSSLCSSVTTFQSEVLETYRNHKKLLNFSTQKLWDEWNTRGIKLINDIFEKKKNLISKFADLIVYQIKNVYKNQDQLLKDANSRQDEWKRIFNEIISEFKSLGYVLDSPKALEVNYELINDLNTKELNLSEEVKQTIFYQPNFSISIKADHLFGLEPKVIDDDHFLIIDQVWPELSEEQESLIKENIAKEVEEASEKQAARKLQEVKDEIYQAIYSQHKKIKRSNIFDFFPKHNNSSELTEKTELFEKYLLKSKKEKIFSASHTVGQLKENLYNLARNLLSLKSVNVINSRLEVSDTGFIKDDINTEIFTDKDWFIKSGEQKMFDDSIPNFDISLADTDICDISDDDYMKIVDHFDDIQDESDKLSERPIVPPSLEEWAQISIKKFREKRNKVDFGEIQNKLLLLEDEIAKISEIQTKHCDEHNLELAKRNYLDGEIKLDLSRIQQFLVSQESELSTIISNIQKEIEKTIEETDKNI